MCGPEGSQLRTSIKSNGNILKHIKRRHLAQMDSIREKKNIKSRSTRFENRLKVVPISVKRGTNYNFVQIPDDLNETDVLEGENNLTVEEIEAKEISNMDDVMPDENVTPDPSFRIFEKASDEVEMLEEDYHTASVTQTQDNCFVGHCINPISSTRCDKELVELKKELMQKEFDEARTMRQQKHQLEMDLLRMELRHKEMEHQKRMALMNKRIAGGDS